MLEVKENKECNTYHSDGTWIVDGSFASGMGSSCSKTLFLYCLRGIL
jgi:hypothetical protein